MVAKVERMHNLHTAYISEICKDLPGNTIILEGYIPDAIQVIDGKIIAIEIELNKPKTAIERIKNDKIMAARDRHYNGIRIFDIFTPENEIVQMYSLGKLHKKFSYRQIRELNSGLSENKIHHMLLELMKNKIISYVNPKIERRVLNSILSKKSTNREIVNSLFKSGYFRNRNECKKILEAFRIAGNEEMFYKTIESIQNRCKRLRNLPESQFEFTEIPILTDIYSISVDFNEEKIHKTR